MAGQWLKRMTAVTLMAGMCTTAYAGQYDAESLGQALPMWMETLASINDHGDVAWTAWDGSSTSARFYRDGGEQILLDSTAGESWAVSVTRRVADGDTQVVGIAGSEASSQRLTDRSALLWDVRWEDNTAPTSTIIDLGAATDKLDSNQEGTVQQSAAYGVVEKSGSANRYYVGGFARDKVHKNVLPKPVIWDVEGSTIDVVVLDTLANTDTATGYVSSIARDGSNIWACGNSTDSGAYNQATCWDLSDGPEAASADGQLVHDLTSSSVFGTNVISSMVHRVRYVPVGEDGALEPVAVGSALVGSGGNAQWKGFAYNLSTGKTWTDLNLTDENETMAYDVAGLTYDGHDAGATVTSHGLQIAGISSTADSADLGGLEGGPLGADASKMTGIERRAFTSGITDEGQVCRIQDDSEDVGNYEQLLALSSDGTYRLAMSEGELVRLTTMPSDADIDVLNRYAKEQKHYYSGRADRIYHQARVKLVGSSANAAELQLGTAVACDNVPDIGGVTCDNDKPISFDVESSVRLDLTPVTGGLIGTIGGATNTLVSDRVEGSAFSIDDHVYAQVALRKDDECTITPVYPSNTINVDTPVGTTDGETDTDFDGDLTWTWCDSEWVDTQTDYLNCGTCSNIAEVDHLSGQHNDRPLSHCVYGQCVDGVAEIESNSANQHKNNTCFIDSTCYEPNEGRPISAGAENVENFCQVCDPSAPNGQTTWNTIDSSTNSCCEDGEPTSDVWEVDYRPTTPNNISYSGTTMTSNWIPRLMDITDGNFWGYGHHSGTWDCGRNSRPGALVSYLNGLADQEDWYWFRHLDKNSGGTGDTEPRVRLKPQSGANLDLCVYYRCVNNPSRDGVSANEWGDGALSSVSRSTSPLHDGDRGLLGYCSSASSSGARDIELLVEDRGCGGSGAWDVDVYIQVKYRDTPDATMCEDGYELQWGNDSYRYYRRSTSTSARERSTPGNGRGSAEHRRYICDDDYPHGRGQNHKTMQTAPL